MGKRSSIERLPPDVLERLQALLHDPRVTELEIVRRINALLEEDGHPERISKSSLNRYSQKMDAVGEKLRHTREIADMWIGRFGNAPQGKVGALLNETIRCMAFETTMNLAEGAEPVPPKVVRELARAVYELERAASENEKREAEIRQQARTEAAEEAAKAVREAEVLKGQDGISEELEASIRRILIGKG